MYYEECVIDGVLYWRGTSDGEWAAKTPQQLTQMLLEARREKVQSPVTPVVVQPVFVQYPQHPATSPLVWHPPSSAPYKVTY